ARAAGPRSRTRRATRPRWPTTGCSRSCRSRRSDATGSRATHYAEEIDMATRFLIEVPHEGNLAACVRAVDVFLKSGSHFLSRADWGCKDGEHKAWVVVEVESKDDARHILP